jgi:Raf kinase inhibitor-like YbhB/YbcL family protein
MRLLRMLAVFTMALTLAFCASTQRANAQAGGAPAAPAPPPLTLTSTSFGDGTVIPDKYTQAGNQTSPELSWTNTPAGTVSFVLHMHDLDVSRNKTTDDQLHWLVWNIPGNVVELSEGLPMGQMQNGAYQVSASGPAYRGPGAPATGPRHHYTFELYALDTKLDIQPGTDAFATRVDVMKAIQGHILGKAVYMGLFRKPK